MRKLLIADRSVCDALRELLCKKFEIRCCRQDEQVLQQLVLYQPDVLVLDLMLTGTDGISVLQEAHGLGLKPVTVATSCYISDYVLSALEALQVSYLMRKPCSLQALASRVLDAAGPDPEEEPDSLRTAVAGIFLHLGLRQNLLGYRYLTEAVLAYYRDPRQSVTKELYPAAAQVLGGTGAQAERAIRTCIQDAYVKRSEAVWRLYFPAGRDGRVRKVTNTHFIAKIADCLRCTQQTR